MSSSIQISSRKKSAPKSSTHHVTPQSATFEATAPAAAPAAASTGHAPPSSSDLLAAQAKKQLDAIEAQLGLDIVVAPNDKNEIRALRRVSPFAMRLAAEIVTSAPTRFPDFDGSGLVGAGAYVEAMSGLADRADALAAHVRKSVWNQHVPAARQTLSLYAVVKGLGRIVDNETMREKVAVLHAELAPKRKNPRPKQTKEQARVKAAAKARAKRAAKALLRLQANTGPLVVPVEAPPSPPAAGPAPAH